MSGVRGFVAQGMDGRKKAITSAPYNFPPGTHTFTAPAAGVYRFVMWGCGGGFGGGSGAFIQAERPLAQGQRVAIVVAACDASPPTTNTTVTFPTGEVLTAGSPTVTNTVGGLATAAARDIAISGSKGFDGTAPVAGGGDNGGAAGTGGQGGAGAPGWGSHKGGDGGNNVSNGSGETPGAGGYVGTGNWGGNGLVLVYRVKIRR